LTSPYARPDRPAAEELDRLLAALEEELGLKKGSGKAELEPAAGRGRVADLTQARQRIALLEGENQLLRQRIAAAREQVEQLRTRLRFIEDRGAGDAA
jgi:hypothetical protein